MVAPEAAGARRGWRRLLVRAALALAVMGLLLVVVIVAVVVVVVRNASTIATTPADFAKWKPLGGATVRQLDSDQTFALGVTSDSARWSGLIERGEPTCGVQVTGRVRIPENDSPGGFGIGLAVPTSVDGAEVPHGIGVETVAGLGYRVVRYPEIAELDRQPDRLDDDWHELDVRMDDQGIYTMDVDGVTVVSFRGERLCGSPVVRIVGGEVELADIATRSLPS